LFKKLQKEIEMAIRNSDFQNLGSLDLPGLEQCFFLLEYLPMLKESKMLRRTPNPKNSSNAAQHSQEEAFLEAFWHIINPKGLPRVLNAHLYNILLLVIYKVNQPLGQTVQSLSEYLCKYYEMQRINLGYPGDEDETTVRKVDHFLTMQKLWSLNRLVLTFK
jgi:hypothetical protein